MEKTTARTWRIFRIAVIISGIIVLFFSGLFKLEEYIALVPPEVLTASVIPSDVATLTNENRIEEGLPALRVNPLLTQAAQLKAEDMAKKSYYAHISPEGQSPLYWLQKVGYQYLNAGENLVIDRKSSEEAVDAWMHSTDHRENILRPQFTEIGIGVAEGEYKGTKTIFVVQEFGTPYPLSVNAVKPVKAPKSVAAKPVPVPPVPVIAIPAPVKKPEVTPELAIIPVPQTAIVTRVNTLTSPVVRALIPAVKPKPAPVRIAVTTATSTIAATTTTATTTPTEATSSPAFELRPTFTLPPEFFTPVTPALGQAATELANPSTLLNAAPEWLGSIRAYLQKFYKDVPRLWK